LIAANSERMLEHGIGRAGQRRSVTAVPLFGHSVEASVTGQGSVISGGLTADF